MSDDNKTCSELVYDAKENRIEDLQTLWDLYNNDPDLSNEDLGNMYEYGLAFDYVAPHTFKNQARGYFRYQLSWGGPSEEFRIYAEQISEYRWSVDKIEFWYLGWFDGAKVILLGQDFDLLEEIFTSFFVDSGSADSEHSKAMENYEPQYDEEYDSEEDEE